MSNKFLTVFLCYLCTHMEESTLPHRLSSSSVVDAGGHTLVSFFSVSRSLLCFIVVPRTRLQLGIRAFCVVGPVVWNSLLLDIRSVPTLSTFKKHAQDTFLAS